MTLKEVWSDFHKSMWRFLRLEKKRGFDQIVSVPLEQTNYLIYFELQAFGSHDQTLGSMVSENFIFKLFLPSYSPANTTT